MRRLTLFTSALAIAAAVVSHASAEVTTHDVPQPYAPHTLMFDATAGGTDADQMTALAKSYGTWGFDVSGMDTSIKPGDDFFMYANGKALANMTIPGDQPGYGSFNKLADLSELREKVLVTDLASQTGLTGDDQKIADMYKSVMNVDVKNQRDMAPMEPELNAIAAITTKSQMANYMGKTSGRFGSAFFGIYVSDDAKNPGFYALQASQGGLGLPDRDYYLVDTYADKLKAYEGYVADMLARTGYPDAARHAHDIVALETEIAKVSWTRTESRDDTKTYNPMKLSELPGFAPGFDWNAFFKGAGVTKAKKVIVAQNTAFPKIAAIFAGADLETLKAWEAFHTIDQASAYLSDRFYNARFDFRSKTLYGVEEQRPLWKRAVGAADDNLGDALGHAYADRYFPAESKAKMQALIANLLAAMKIRIENLTWMSDGTKQKALTKLSMFGVRVGYQDHWRDYSRLTIKPDDIYGNIERSSAFEWAHRVSQIDGPIDPDDWGMEPQTVNAEYIPTRNEIVFPAAILSAPFFDPNADMAVNYGGIGAVIGHEITHGFDDQGRHYDGKGALTDWWTQDDSDKFTVQTKMLGAQYDTYQPVEGVNVKGDQTMGENIADLGGLLMASDAYHMSLNGQPDKVIDGFSGDQRFFLGFAQVWQSKYKDDFMKFLVTADVHAPDHFRPIGATRNNDLWYQTFNVQPGEKYYLKPEDRVRIW